MIIDCISDLHGFYHELEGGDLLIIAGDLTAKHTLKEFDYFNEWVREQDYDKKILIGGNHDTFLENGVYNPFDVSTHHSDSVFVDSSVDYLIDSGTEYKGLKIFGSPWTAQFPGININCCAFTIDYDYDTEKWLEEYWNKIPTDTDVLITHCPPYGILDKTRRNEHAGSKTLRDHVIGRIKPQLHVFGHIHECGGKLVDCVTTKFINASIVNEDYEAVNKPVRIIL